jgi:hypothetical protein
MCSELCVVKEGEAAIVQLLRWNVTPTARNAATETATELSKLL